MKTALLATAVWVAAGQSLAADALSADEIAKLPFMSAFAYAEAIDAYCLPDWHYASTALAVAAITQANLQDKSYLGAEETVEATLLRRDRSACQVAKAYVDKVSATIADMQPRMETSLALHGNEEARRDARRTRAALIEQCRHVVATVKAFLVAKWPLGDGGYEEELPRCIAGLAAMPEAGSLLGEAKALLPQLTERIRLQSPKDRITAEEGEVDPQRIIADWCSRQTVKTALCDETTH
jgi:hypothetical protein